MFNLGTRVLNIWIRVYNNSIWEMIMRLNFLWHVHKWQCPLVARRLSLILDRWRCVETKNLSIYLIELSGSSAESEELRWMELKLTWFMIRALREIFHCSFQISIYSSMVLSNSIPLYFINSLLCAKRNCNNRFWWM